MYIKIIFLLNLLISIEFSISYEFTFSQLKTCKEYEVKDSFYKQFFKVDNLEQNNRSDNELIRLQFYTLTLMDAHILLSETDSPQLTDRVYDIVMGAGQNTYSTIRLKLNSNGVTRIDGSIDFDPWIPTPIEISQTIDGKLTIYIFNKEYIIFNDNNPLLINFVSFKSYGGIPAKWFYDCKFDGHENDITMEDRKISDMEHLEQNLFAEYDTYTRPHNLEKIKISFAINGAFHDRSKSILRTRISIIMIWEDHRLKWNSSNYGDINIITGTEYSLWMPFIVIYNGAEETHKGLSLRGVKQKIYENGKIEIETRNTEISSWCSERSTKWPNSNLSCEIKIGEAHEDIHLHYDENLILQNFKINQFASWSVENSKQSQNKIDKSDLEIQILFKINRNFYLYLYYTPMFVSITFILLSFVLNGEKRGIVNIFAIIIILLSFPSLVNHCSKAKISPLVNSYISVSIISTFTYLLHVLILLITNCSPLLSPCEWLLTMIYSRTIRFLLGMTFTNCDYLNVHDNPWKQLAQFLNRIGFMVVLSSFSFVICKNILYSS